MPLSTRRAVELLVIGLVFHVVFSSSIFDCYFRNPVVQGMRHYGYTPEGSKRLVLFVGDGLRADVLFTPTTLLSNDSSKEVVAPYLRSIVEERGAFGISHTRIPTETRPGHLAMIAGMYEDASEITKGWGNKPIKVDFDSVFNQSSQTFIFGAPDILPIFADPLAPSNIRGWSFDWQALDYTKDASVLDTWVLDQLRILLRNASEDNALYSDLHKDKIVIFLHLLGVDNTGHSYRPHSKEYIGGIRIVDNIVRETEKLVSNFYGDEETSFIFTADHGMTNIGNHGDGDPDATRTPLIAWGKGVRGPVPDSVPSSHDDYSRLWNLDHLLRRDVSQADIAPIMASLLGINWPANSVGVLPDVDPTRAGFLKMDGGEKALAHAAWTNTQVLLEHYRVKHRKWDSFSDGHNSTLQVLKQEKSLSYQPYIPLESVKAGMPVRIQKLVSIEQSLMRGQWNRVRFESMELISSLLEGLHYLDTYDSFLIRSMVIIGYIGWIAYICSSLFPALYVYPTSTAAARLTDTFAMLTFAGFAAVFWMQNSSGAYYLYIAFPCYFWREFFRRGAPALVKFIFHSSLSTLQSCIYSLLTVVTLQGMVAAYYHRQIWGVGFFVIGVLWPYCTWPPSILMRKWKLPFQWGLSCLVTGTFFFLPVDKKETLSTILFGGLTMLIVGATYTWRSEVGSGFNGRKLSTLFQMGLLIAIMVVTFGSVRSLQAKNGLPPFNNTAAWTILMISSIYPFVTPVLYTSPTSKIMSFFLAFSVCFVVLSICDEGLFLSAFTCNLLLWIEMETAIRQPLDSIGTASVDRNGHHFRADDIRTALFFLFFTQIAFFGAGNVPSISSFFLEPVYRLVTIYNPYLVLFLLMFKILIPFMILSLIVATLNARLHLPPFSLLFVALTLVDGMVLFYAHAMHDQITRHAWTFTTGMTLTFFLNVTDTGSWFDIGRSINAFCTASLLLVWSTGTCAAGGYLMRNALATPSNNKLKDGDKGKGD